MKNLYEKEGTKKVLASLISILAGLLVGAILVLVVGFVLYRLLRNKDK